MLYRRFLLASLTVALTAAGIAPAASATTPADFLGTWTTPIVQRNQFTRNRISLRPDGTFTVVYERGRDSQAGDAVSQTTGTYVISTESPEGSGQHTITYRLGTATLTTLTLAGTLGANFLQVCGMRGWQRNIARSIVGRDCTPDGKLPAQNGLIYDIVRKRDGMLVFGLPTSTNDRLTPQTLPKAYDEGLVYKKIGN